MQLRSITDPEEGKEIVRTFAATEYYILYSHSSLLADEEFMGVGANFLLNGAYLMCIENLLKQYPELGESPLFLERTSKILDYNDALMDEYQGKPNSDADCTLEPGDEEDMQDKNLWKEHNKVKKKVNQLKKDS